MPAHQDDQADDDRGSQPPADVEPDNAVDGDELVHAPRIVMAKRAHGYELHITVPGNPKRHWMNRRQAIDLALAILTVCGHARAVTSIVIATTSRRDTPAAAAANVEKAGELAAAIAARYTAPLRQHLAPFVLNPAVGNGPDGPIAVVMANVDQWKENDGVGSWEHFAYDILRVALSLEPSTVLYEFITSAVGKLGDRDADELVQIVAGVGMEAAARDEIRRGRFLQQQREADQAAGAGGGKSAVRVQSSGMKVFVDPEVNPLPGIPDPVPGEHLWMLANTFRIADPAGESPYHLDTENLLTVTPVFCFVCEQPWEPGMEKTSCTGESSEHESPR